MKIGILQLNFKVGDCQGNANKIIQGYHAAVEKGAALVITSELALFGYPPGDMLLRSDFLKRQNRCLHELSRHIHQTGLIVGAATETRKEVGMPLYNSAALIQNKEIVHLQHKTLLPNYDVFDPMRCWTPFWRPISKEAWKKIKSPPWDLKEKSSTGLTRKQTPMSTSEDKWHRA
jgi:predicted amidohydrolase